MRPFLKSVGSKCFQLYRIGVKENLYMRVLHQQEPLLHAPFSIALDEVRPAFETHLLNSVSLGHKRHLL